MFKKSRKELEGVARAKTEAEAATMAAVANANAAGAATIPHRVGDNHRLAEIHFEREQWPEEPEEPSSVPSLSWVLSLERAIKQRVQIANSAKIYRSMSDCAKKEEPEEWPKVDILENVFGALWEMYQQQIFPLIGYYAKYMRQGGKDYHLPQTRQCGYLFAIDCQSVTLHEAEKIARHRLVFPDAPNPARLQALAGRQEGILTVVLAPSRDGMHLWPHLELGIPWFVKFHRGFLVVTRHLSATIFPSRQQDASHDINKDR
ncbi:hypothetical protein QBC44DRAFT_402404 [Cladorrhinum sp. PSN332]|nr:hypothetical protein QBC44DRAFT_402404 [Cladorrhinum sp. PSN332]